MHCFPCLPGGGLHLFGCTKPHVAKTYKALAAAAQPGGKLAGLARLPPVKQSVSLSLSPEVACSVALEALKATLLRCGWTAFDDSLLLGMTMCQHSGFVHMCCKRVLTGSAIVQVAAF